MIVEVEAYHESEPAAHTFGGRTERNKTMFEVGGHLYVYRIHQSTCCNIVVGPAGEGSAVLIRGLLPTSERETIAARRNNRPEPIWTNGPGKLCQALAITADDDGQRLLRGDGPVRLLEQNQSFSDDEVEAGPRIGISKAVDLPWRLRVLKHVRK